MSLRRSPLHEASSSNSSSRFLEEDGWEKAAANSEAEADEKVPALHCSTDALYNRETQHDNECVNSPGEIVSIAMFRKKVLGAEYLPAFRYFWE